MALDGRRAVACRPMNAPATRADGDRLLTLRRQVSAATRAMARDQDPLTGLYNRRHFDEVLRPQPGRRGLTHARPCPQSADSRSASQPIASG